MTRLDSTTIGCILATSQFQKQLHMDRGPLSDPFLIRTSQTAYVTARHTCALSTSQLTSAQS